MRKFVAFNLMVLALLSCVPITQANGDGFGDVVKLIEQFYHVKHQGIPLLARAGVKTATTVARISGGRRRQLAEAGSVRVAYFEDQDFSANGGYTGFKSSMNALLVGWTPLIQVASLKDGEQTYIYIRDAGAKFNVMVVTIDQRDAFVVQMNLSPQNLAKLMRDPDEMGQTITSEATDDDQ
ncbi:MAG TPA: hypothetical protein VGO56_14370 [Pyrinomonadaceae bacterium]|jgi:hypothetical protein|nr:hypothetical protein [Pyrinomonadaceae bacterium]